MDKVLQDSRLHPTVRELGLKLQTIVKAKYGITILYCQGFRSHEQQARLYAKGRTVSGKKVTNCKPYHSYHEYGLALDFVPLIDGKARWDRTDLFKIIGEEAEKLPMTWGGRFKSIKGDLGHIERNFGYKISELIAGKRPANTPKGV